MNAAGPGKPNLDWGHQKVLVTGAGGFIGSHLAERLVALGAHTRALVRYSSTGTWGWLETSPVKGDIEVIAADIRDRDSLEAAVRGVDIIFHLAALIGIPYSYHAPLSYVQTNVEGTLNVLQTARNGGVGLVVQASTSEVYGTARYVPINEDHPLQAQSPYSASKIASDKLAEAFHLSFGLPVAIIRPFNTYGPRQSARAVIPSIITQALSNQEIRLGNLKPSRDFCYVMDTVEGFVKIAERPEAIGQVINVGTGREICIGALAGIIAELAGKDISIVCDDQRVRPEHSEVERLCADISKARGLLGWGPRYTLEQGLDSTVEWIRDHLRQYKPSAYAI